MLWPLRQLIIDDPEFRSIVGLAYRDEHPGADHARLERFPLVLSEVGLDPHRVSSRLIVLGRGSHSPWLASNRAERMTSSNDVSVSVAEAFVSAAPLWWCHRRAHSSATLP
jgi:hypothetical protein